MNYVGKFRGTVVDNEDPENLHRLRVKVGTLVGVEKSWALPCVPYAGPGIGIAFLPPKHADVWIEFENGDPSLPVWSGCFWSNTSRKPVDALTPDVKVIQTPGMKLIIDDTKGKAGVTLEVGTALVDTPVPVTIRIDKSGLQIQMQQTQITLDTKSIMATVPATKATMTAEAVKLTTSGDITVEAQKTAITSQVDVTGATTIKGDVKITGQTSANGNVSIVGETAVKGQVGVTGPLAVTGNASVTGPLSVTGTASVTGEVTAATLMVPGTATIAGSVIASSVIAPNNLM